MIDPQTLQALKDTLTERQGDGPVTLATFGRMLGRAIKRKPYSRSDVHRLLNGEKPITAQIDRAAHILMSDAASISEQLLVDPMPILHGRPIEKPKAQREAGVDWQGLYTADADVRAFVDALADLVARA